MKRRIPIAIGALIITTLIAEMAFTADTPTLPKVTNFGAYLVDGRQVRLSWYLVNAGSRQDIYDVYRDGVKLATVLGKQSDPETNGQLWYYASGLQYFFDNAAWPGTTHTYSIIARTADGDFSEATERIYAVPTPSVITYSITTSGGRMLRFNWYHVKGKYFNVLYDIYRDGEKIASFADGATGESAKGDSWESNASYQYYTDSEGFPGKTHTYKIVANLFSGCSVEKIFSYTISLPSISIYSITSQGGRTVSFNWSHVTGSFFDTS